VSLATRCPACGTVFRVVRDQLKVSSGWVRCGRCSEVFNAGQRLFDLEREDTTSAQAQDTAAASQEASARTPAAPPASGRASSGLALDNHGGHRSATARVRSALAPPSEHGVLWAPESESGRLRATSQAMPLDAGTQFETPPAEAADAVAVDAPASESAGFAADMAAVGAVAPAAETAPDATSETMPTPDFIRRADSAARWRHPARRGMLATLSLLLAAILAVQVALHYRDSLAAGWPASRPWLQAACDRLDCRIEAPRRIDSLSVESSGLVRVDGSPAYRLSLVLQNRASTVVHMPAIELALTDTQGQTMARRVLYAAELGSSADSLAPRGEVLLQATLELGETRVAGYTIELFYP